MQQQGECTAGFFASKRHPTSSCHSYADKCAGFFSQQGSASKLVSSSICTAAAKKHECKTLINDSHGSSLGPYARRRAPLHQCARLGHRRGSENKETDRHARSGRLTDDRQGRHDHGARDGHRQGDRQEVLEHEGPGPATFYVQCGRRLRDYLRGIRFRAPHAIDATCFRSCVRAMAWRFHAFDATSSPWPRRASYLTG